MIHIPAQARVFLFPEQLDKDTQMDFVAGRARSHGRDPYSGELFVLKSEDCTMWAILGYDGHGFNWCIKRFSEGIIPWWPAEKTITEIPARDLQVLLWGGDPTLAEFAPMCRPLYEEHPKRELPRL